MRKVIARLIVPAFFLLTFTLSLPGCGGSGGDELKDYDPEVSKQKAAEYEEQMREAMQKQGRPVPKR